MTVTTILMIESLDIVDIFGKTCEIDFSGHVVLFPEFTREQVELLMRYVIYDIDHGLGCGLSAHVDIHSDIETKPYKYIDVSQFITERGIHSINKLLGLCNSRLAMLERSIKHLNSKPLETGIIAAIKPGFLRHLDRTQENINIIQSDLLDKYMSIPREQLIKYYLSLHGDTKRTQFWQDIDLDQESIDGLTKTEEALFKINDTPTAQGRPATWDERKQHAEQISDWIKTEKTDVVEEPDEQDDILDLNLDQLEEDYLTENLDTIDRFAKYINRYLERRDLQVEDNKILLPGTDYDTIYKAVRYACDQLCGIPYTTNAYLSGDYKYFCTTI